MPLYKNTRTLALVGHSGAGKTSLFEGLLAATGTIASRGSVERGNTVSDHDPLERQLGLSIQSSVASFAVGEVRLNVIDTPGTPDFIGQALPALEAVDTAVLVVNASAGVELNTERLFDAAGARGLCRMIVLNRIDADNVDLPARVAELRERFGKQCLLLDLPVDHAQGVVELLAHTDGLSDFASVATEHRALIDQLVEEDDSLLAQYLEDGADPSPDALHQPFEAAMRAGHLIPILFTSAKTGAGVAQLLDALVRLAPNPSEANPPLFVRRTPDAPEHPYPVVCDDAAHVLAHVFKIVMDPFIGKVSVFRVHQGTLRKDQNLFIGTAKKPFKVNHLYRLQGSDHVEVDQLRPGEVGAVAKVDDIALDAVLHDSHDEDDIALRAIDYPQPMQGLAVEPQRKGDEQRLFEVLAKLQAEDPCFTVERHPHTHETVIRGLGEMHLRTKMLRMQQQFKLELNTHKPQIAYRETITSTAEGHCRHKKQSGGAGQFGEVMLRVEPLARGAGFEFVDVVKGGAIPGVFMPAVQKGVEQALTEGAIAGFALHDLRVTVVDGKTHPVDGKEVAFVTAARKATLEAVRAASPVVLEPIVTFEVITPESHMGDLTGDLAARRAQITATQARVGGQMAVSGQIALAELGDYQGRLKSLTGGQGSYSVRFSHYAPVADVVQSRLVAAFKPAHDED